MTRTRAPITIALTSLLAVAALAQDVEHVQPAETTDRDRAVLEALAVLEMVRPEPAERLERPTPVVHDDRALPANLDSMPTIRFRVVRTLGGESIAATGSSAFTTEDLVTRSPSAVSMQPTGAGQGWLLRQNAAFPRRATGYLLDLNQRLVLEHEDTDLRVRGIVRDWVDALVLGFDLGWLDRGVDTGETRTVAGYAFRRVVHTPESSDELGCEVWWSDELMLPLEVTLTKGDSRWTQRVESLEVLEVLAPGEAPQELSHPAEQRFIRTFQRMTLSDWYDIHFGCDCAPPGQSLAAAARGQRPTPTPEPITTPATPPVRSTR